MIKYDNLNELSYYQKISNSKDNAGEEDNIDFEDWEADHELLMKEDYKGLVKYREKVVKANPKEFYPKLYLSEAYILNKEYEKAIEYLTTLHEQDPEDLDIQYMILDALFALDKNEYEYRWKIKPTVIELNSITLDQCYNMLKGKRKGKTVADLYIALITEGYLKFKEKDLYKVLENDHRFLVERDSILELCMVKTVKMKE